MLSTAEIVAKGLYDLGICPDCYPDSPEHYKRNPRKHAGSSLGWPTSCVRCGRWFEWHLDPGTFRPDGRAACEAVYLPSVA